MLITKEFLASELAGARQQEASIMAAKYRAEGAIRVLEALVTHEARPEPEPEKRAKKTK